jgi:para-aminobenzoate synthetase component 1
VTSLPREEYLSAVRTLKRHITRGDIYQANLCQQFRLGCSGDELELYRELATRAPAPRSAFFDTGRVRLVSVSPETFLTLDASGRIATHPIKGTRPRGASEAADREQRESLLRSPKDHAELLMIVDLERNDLGRVCRTGSVRVTGLAALRSFATVHHLVASVEGRLEPGIDMVDLLRASFPGGSITGAPKLRAIELLAGVEPVRRGWFTGSLFWFGDDGTTDSSILIRSLVLRDGRAWLGAGGGIVADSDPEEEWRESNHKARALAEALGFDPEEAR